MGLMKRCRGVDPRRGRHQAVLPEAHGSLIQLGRLPRGRLGHGAVGPDGPVEGQRGKRCRALLCQSVVGDHVCLLHGDLEAISEFSPSVAPRL